MADDPEAVVFSFSADAVAGYRDWAATSLIGRFFFPEPKSAWLIQATMSNIYGVKQALTVIELGLWLHQLFFSTREEMQKVLKRRPLSMDGYLIHVSPWKAPSPDLFRSLQHMKLWIRLERFPNDFRTLSFTSGLLGTIGEVMDAGMFYSLDETRYFLCGFFYIDVLRPFIRWRRVGLESRAEFWVRLRYEGYPQFASNVAITMVVVRHQRLA
ncbi:hypothetical protein LINGRAHAP2_LOCUS24286 [Linum grandiflorum]